MQPWRIAIVDDDLLVGKSLERLLRSHGCDVCAYSSAAEFLRESDDLSFTCLILDLCMPKMSGTELYQQLRKTGQELPTILMSAHEEELRRATESLPEVQSHLHKPFDDDQLLRAVRKAVEHKDSTSL